MHLVYENTKEEIIAIKKTPVHRPPHLHNALEIVYVTEGCVELGVGEEPFPYGSGRHWFYLSKYHSPLSSIFMSAQSGNLFKRFSIPG